MNILALLGLAQVADINWPATAGMLTVIILASGGVGALISALVVKPMIATAVTELRAASLPRELFLAYKESDQNEHKAMQTQLDAIFARLNR